MAQIWHLKFPNKVKMFVWRLAHNSLPVRRNVANCDINIDIMCPICRRLDEDCGHCSSNVSMLNYVGAS